MSTETGAAPAATAEATPAENAAPAEAAAQAAKMYKLRVNGQEQDVSEDVVLREAQIARAMREKYNKSEQARKADKAWLDRLSGDDYDAAILEKVGDERFHNAAVKYLSNKLKQEMMSPEQRRYMAMEQENARLKGEATQREQAQKAAEHKHLTDFYAKQFDQEIPTAMKGAGLPQTPAVLKRFAELMTENIQHDINLPTAAIAQLVRDEMRSETRTLLEGLSDEDLEEFMDEKLLGRYKKGTIAKVKAAQKAARAAPAQRSSEAPKEMSVEDFRDYVERVKRGEE